MEKDEILSRVFSVASSYEDTIERSVHNATIDRKEELDMKKDLEALKEVLNYFDAHYDEYTDIQGY